MVNDLLLLSGNDIPFIEAGVTIHQPSIKEIAYIGEEAFFTGCELLNFSKNILPEEDKMNLEDKTNFDILIAILREPNAVMQKNRNCVNMVLALIFPEYYIAFTNNGIQLKKENEQDSHYINNENFEIFKQIVNQMFNYSKESSTDYNPAGERARQIAEKLKQRQKKLAEVKNQKNKIDIISRYMSILTVGQQKNMRDFLEYTIYQLFDEFQRFELKMGYDIYIQAKMAGAKDLKDVEDWMQDIHSNKN